MTIPQAPSSDLKFSSADFDRILASTFIEHIDYCNELPSTNTRAMQLAGELPDHVCPVLVLTDSQTSGRGRGTNLWWSDNGSLTFSVLVRPLEIHLPAGRWPQLSLTAGLAVCDALESLIGGLKSRIKWPNDVFVSGRKICGILVEAASGQRRSVIIGIGVNVNNSAVHAPPELREAFVALRDLAPGPIRRVDVLLVILKQLDSRLKYLVSSFDALSNEWSERCLLTGRTVEIEFHARRISGLCRGIDEDGAILLDTPTGRERFLSGVVTKFD
jgi:BirA family transcriptional regulator, biotin operon repressor / biotin---[acetyl-CoA-carboxylase] ligase